MESFQCDLCPATFGLQKDRQRHKDAIHSEQRFQCDVCDFQANRRDNLKRHIKSKHIEPMMRIDDNNFLGTFVQARNEYVQEGDQKQKDMSYLGLGQFGLVEDIKKENGDDVIHPNKKIKTEEGVTPKHNDSSLMSKFGENSDINYSTFIKSEPVEDDVVKNEPYNIEIEPDLGSLIMQNKEHEGEKPYACDKCELKFKTKKNLLRHARDKHGKKRFVCTPCKYETDRPYSLTEHKNTQKHADTIRCLSKQECVLCFAKTYISETEDGEVIMCEKCKTERIEEEFATVTDCNKDGTVIDGFNEVLIEGNENMEQSQVVIETSNICAAEGVELPTQRDEEAATKGHIKMFDKNGLVIGYKLAEGTSETQTQKQKQKQPKRGTCDVCHSEQNIFKQHCTSCRCFFGRFLDKPLSCIIGENNCEITEITRTNCKSCRYNRCVAVGMERPKTVENERPVFIIEHVDQGSTVQINFKSQDATDEVIKKPRQSLLKSQENMCLTGNPEESVYPKGKLIPCEICGSLEVAHKNYGVDCCNSCKIFFLRNVVRDINYACVAGTNNCVITRVNRTNCKSCRYKRCIAAGFPTNMNDLQKRETFIKKQKSSNATEDEYKSKDPNASEHDPKHVYWMAEDETVPTDVKMEETAINIEVGDPVKLEVKCEPPDFEQDHTFVKSEPIEHDDIMNEPYKKIELGMHSILHYDPLAENTEDVQMTELLNKTVEGDHKTQEKTIEVEKTTKPKQNVRDPLDTSIPHKSTKKPSPKANEKDPLDTSQACCHICQAEAPGLLFYGGLCCYSCRIFFRRAVGSVFLCSAKGNKCLINKATRTKCKSCRFQRCLDVGMNPGLVDRKKKTSQEDGDECDSQN